ncbi:ABC transporter ATP-binding protein [Garciella nitratireducens]|uniref:ABC transporter ATP-binding protein n=1 Tax=Garciella nitratireducens TaxID=218205 RepID=UPI000DEB8F0C|nr:ABC transporter ATP-binding protein [Garciella nitratireducens]RBP35940.1 ABC-2 type transport system ATP-binding protein [Garciella nitratireducens]
MSRDKNIVLEVRGLSKKFDNRVVIQDASFSIKKNTIVGLIGKNGAGKTTLMKMLIGFLKPTSGSMILNNKNIKFGDCNPQIGYLTDVPVYYDFMTAYEYLYMCACLKNIDKVNIVDEVMKLLNLVNLESSKDKRIKGYSRGMKQRLGIAQCLIGKPSLIICDEPMSALDPKGREEVIEIFSKLKSDASILLSTHILDDIDRLCDEVVVVDKGIVKSIESSKRLSLSSKNKLLEIDFNKQYFVEKFELFLKNNNILYRLKGRTISILELDSDITKKIYHFFATNDECIYPNSIKILDATIDDIF